MADQDIQEAKEDEYVASTSNWYSLMWLFHPRNTLKLCTNSGFLSFLFFSLNVVNVVKLWHTFFFVKGVSGPAGFDGEPGVPGMPGEPGPVGNSLPGVSNIVYPDFVLLYLLHS